jgi:hypothetical protein
LQAFPSEQLVPFAAGGLEHTPVAGSQVPALWQASVAVQTFADPPWQAPPWHVSPLVHELPSLQAVPFGAAGLEQAPVAGSHVPATWQASDAVQTLGVPAMQFAL